MRYHARKNIVTDGLVFSVDANNSLGGNTTDTKNLTNPSETGSFVNGTSVINGEYDFDGVDDYIDFGNIQKPVNISISCWIKTTNIGQTGFLVSNSGNVLDGYSLTFNGVTLHAQFSDGSNDSFVNSKITSSSYLTVNTWHNITATYNGNNHLIYVDGILVNTYTKAGSISYVATNLKAGVRNDLAFPYNGQISNVKIYDRALTATEIQQNYEALKHRFDDN